jgi:hypothetical protein
MAPNALAFLRLQTAISNTRAVRTSLVTPPVNLLMRTQLGTPHSQANTDERTQQLEVDPLPWTPEPQDRNPRPVVFNDLPRGHVGVTPTTERPYA